MKHYLALLMILVTMLSTVSASTVSTDSFVHGVVKTSSISTVNSENYKYVEHLENSYYYRVYAMNAYTTDFRQAMPRDYFVTNIDNDEYPDLVIWYLKKIIVWSLGRGVYRLYRVSDPSLYIARPILIDIDKDGVCDFIVIVENNYIDAAIKPYDKLWYTVSRVRVWRPLINHVAGIAEYRKIYIDTNTYVIRGGKLILPWISNYYVRIGNYYKRYYSEIGLFTIDLETLRHSSYRVKKYSSGTVYDPGQPDTCDYTTNYEIYITSYKYNVYLIPSGLDKVVIIKYTGSKPIYIGEIPIGPNSWKDNVIVVARKYPAIPSGGYTSDTYPLATFWRSSQRLDLKMVYGYIVIPWGRFSYKNPTGSENGVYFRVEDVSGVLLIDTYYRRVYKRGLLGRIVYIDRRKYVAVALTSIVFGRGYEVYVGGLAYNSNDEWAAYIARYSVFSDTFNIIWGESVPSNIRPRAFQVTLDITGNKLYGATSNKLYLGDKDQTLLYHSDKTYLKPGYSFYPPSTLKPRSIDIDGDGVYEYCFIMYYNYNSGYTYYPYGLTGLYPSVKDGVSYIIWFDHPSIYYSVTSIEQNNRTVKLKLYFESTKTSYGYLYIRGTSNRVVYTFFFEGESYLDRIVEFTEPGIYRFSFKIVTRYQVNEWIIGGRIPYTIVYAENIYDAYSIDVRCLTRLTMVSPKNNVLTPNTYADGLKIMFKLEYQDLNTYLWRSLERQQYYIRVEISMGDTTRYYRVTYLGKGLYQSIVKGLKPGVARVTITYNPPAYYTGLVEEFNLSLIKYPVTLRIHYREKYPALTEISINATAMYSYLDSSGEWVSEKLDTGYVEFIVKNMSSNETLVIRGEVELTSPNITVTINKYEALPGTYKATLHYIPVNQYYGEVESSFVFNVTKLGLYVELLDITSNVTIRNNSLVIYGSKILVSIREDMGNNTFRNPSVNFSITLNGGTNHTYIAGGEALIDTLYVIPGNYTLTVKPLNYSYVYVPETVVYNFSVIAPSIGFEVEAEPLVKPRINDQSIIDYVGYNRSTYVLTPVKLMFRVKTNYTKLLENASIKIMVDGYTIELKNITDHYTWIPVKPGYKRIVSILETPYIRLVNYTYVTAYPLPVEIIVEKGSIVVLTRDLFNRSAPGIVTVKIYDLEKHLVFTREYRTNGTLVIKPYGLNGHYYVYVEYRGNESYIPTSKYFLVEIHEPYSVTPLPEPRIGVIILISLLTTIMLKKRRNR